MNIYRVLRSVGGLLLFISLAGCQSTTVEQDPNSAHLPREIVTTIHSAFDPKIMDYVKSISIFHVDRIPNFLIKEASGAYIPFTRSIIVSEESSDINRTTVHEMLHVIAWKGLIPDGDHFEHNLERFLADKRYASLVKYCQGQWEKYEEAWLYPNFMRPDEFYAHIGDALLSGSYEGLPDYMEQHYRGILHPALTFDGRYYEGKSHFTWSTVIAWFWFDGVFVGVKAPWRYIDALVRYGGVIRTMPTGFPLVPIRIAQVVRIGSQQQTASQGQFSIQPGTAPSSVSHYVRLGSWELSQLQYRHGVWTVSVQERGRGLLYAGEGRLVQNMMPPTVGIHIPWKETQRLFFCHIHRKLDVSTESSPAVATQSR